RLIPSLQKFDQGRGIVLCPAPLDGIDRARVIRQHAAVIAKPHHARSFGLTIPGWIQNACKSFAPYHRIQTMPRGALGDEGIVAAVHDETMIEKYPPKDQSVRGIDGIYREGLAAQIFPCFDFPPDIDG